jgi:hypothetical protein
VPLPGLLPYLVSLFPKAIINLHDLSVEVSLPEAKMAGMDADEP